jgi:predicted nuclease of predicted toxin-antitoxin system
VRYYFDEDISPKIAEILRQEGIEAVSAHEAGMLQVSDLEQLEYASSNKRCMVTRNRSDYIRLTIQFFNENRPHSGVLIIPHSYPGDQFKVIAKALKEYALKHKEGLPSYAIDFL